MEEYYEDAANHTVITGQAQENASKSNSNNYYLEELNKGVADAQLEVDSIKREIHHLLRQDEQKENEGKFDWVQIEDKSGRTLSDWGVSRIMQVLDFYINKNNLLTNFSEEQIRNLMLKFIRELNDLFLLKYHELFREPTFEECKKIIMDKIEYQTKMEMFANEVNGVKVKPEEIKQKLIENTKRELEREMLKIRNEKRKEKIRDYGMLITQLEVIVFATLNRAWRGEERGSLRRHMNVSELIGNNRNQPLPNNNRGGGGFSWGRR